MNSWLGRPKPPQIPLKSTRDAKKCDLERSLFRDAMGIARRSSEVNGPCDPWTAKMVLHTIRSILSIYLSDSIYLVIFRSIHLFIVFIYLYLYLYLYLCICICIFVFIFFFIFIFILILLSIFISTSIFTFVFIFIDVFHINIHINSNI